jgi:hypothetical protein
MVGYRLRMRMLMMIALPVLLAGCNSEQSRIEQEIARDHLDPDATKFRDVSQCSGDPKVWSGEYNALNAYGAYTGFKRFYYADGSVATFEEGDAEPLIDRCYGKQPSTGGA